MSFEGPAVLLVSPHAGSAIGQETIVAALEAAGIQLAGVFDVRTLHAAEPQGRAWQAQGIRGVIVAGGDGSVGSAATQIGDSDLLLGMLPLGTGNDSARSLGIPIDLAAACAVIAVGTPTPIDVGCASDQSHTELRFLHALQLGINSTFANLATDAARRERLGRLTYAASAVEALTKAQPIPISLEIVSAAGSRRSVNCNALQISVVNLPVFGGALGLRLPAISADDGLLHVIVIEAPAPPELQDLLGGLRAAISGEAEPSAAPAPDDARDDYILPWVRRYAAHALTISSATPIDVTLDGEACAQTPLEVRVAPQRLRVLLPPDAAGTR